MLQRWWAVSNAVSDLTGSKFEPQTSRSRDECVTPRFIPEKLFKTVMKLWLTPDFDPINTTYLSVTARLFFSVKATSCTAASQTFLAMLVITILVSYCRVQQAVLKNGQFFWSDQVVICMNYSLVGDVLLLYSRNTVITALWKNYGNHCKTRTSAIYL